MSCGNNLKQLSLALHNYHDANNGLPPSRGRLTTYDSDWFSGLLLLFPYIELAPAYDELKNTNDKPYAWSASLSMQRTIPAFYCPSQQTILAVGSGNGPNSCRTHYCLSRGDAVYGPDKPYVGATSGETVANTRILFSPNESKGMEYASDGSSNTVVLGEIVAAEEHQSLALKGGYVAYAGMAPKAYAVDAPTGCLLARSGTNMLKRDTTYTIVTANGRMNRGNLLGYGSCFYQAFQTTLPPNSPSCTAATTGDTGWGIYPGSSYHVGGLQAAFLDGSVRFISDVIDWGAGNAKYIEKGESLFGVWGAMGTANCGESASP
jgi:hypothetical protein